MDFGSISMRPSNRRWAVSAIAGGGGGGNQWNIYRSYPPLLCSRQVNINRTYHTDAFALAQRRAQRKASTVCRPLRCFKDVPTLNQLIVALKTVSGVSSVHMSKSFRKKPKHSNQGSKLTAVIQPQLSHSRVSNKSTWSSGKEKTGIWTASNKTVSPLNRSAAMEECLQGTFITKAWMFMQRT